MKRIAFALAIGLALFGVKAAGAPKRVAIDGTCTGCRASAPEGSDPVPLVVVLHGDWGHGPAELLRAWERHAASRGVAVLALQCPKELGCKGSFWRWGGDTSFVTDQVAALREKREIDERRMYLAGWSGGATYIGLHSQDLETTFAAFVFHGGGYPPSSQRCTETKPPTYFLTGDKNPLHAHVGQLRDHYTSCGNEVVWNVLHGADHDAEWSALDKHGGAILDFLLTKKVVEPPAPIASSEAPTTETPPALVPKSATVPPRSGCGCGIASSSAGSSLAATAVLALGALLRRRERRVPR